MGFWSDMRAEWKRSMEDAAELEKWRAEEDRRWKSIDSKIVYDNYESEYIDSEYDGTLDSSFRFGAYYFHVEKSSFCLQYYEKNGSRSNLYINTDNKILSQKGNVEYYDSIARNRSWEYYGDLGENTLYSIYVNLRHQRMEPIWKREEEERQAEARAKVAAANLLNKVRDDFRKSTQPPEMQPSSQQQQSQKQAQAQQKKKIQNKPTKRKASWYIAAGSATAICAIAFSYFVLKEFSQLQLTVADLQWWDIGRSLGIIGFCGLTYGLSQEKQPASQKAQAQQKKKIQNKPTKNRRKAKLFLMEDITNALNEARDSFRQIVRPQKKQPAKRIFASIPELPRCQQETWRLLEISKKDLKWSEQEKLVKQFLKFNPAAYYYMEIERQRKLDEEMMADVKQADIWFKVCLTVFCGKARLLDRFFPESHAAKKSRQDWRWDVFSYKMRNRGC